jgi:hypothetical protein
MKQGSLFERETMRTTRWCAIVGAPRCGTTSLSRYLRAHPSVCFSRLKEPHFFSRRDLEGLDPEALREVVKREYLDRFFPNCPDGAVKAEGSVSYLYAAEHMAPILEVWPDAKFIIALRNPLDMLPSLHQRQLYNGDETVRDFERAWSLIEDRRRGKRIPRSCIDPRLLDYEEIAKLGKHVRRFFDVVGRERCFVSLFDDLKADPEGQHRQILEFLGLPWDSGTEFTQFRPSQGVKIHWLQRLLKRPPKAAYSLLASKAELDRGGHTRVKVNSQAVRRVKSVRKRLLKWNRKPEPPAPLREEFRSKLRDSLRDDIDDLSVLIGRDLSHWLGASESRPVTRDSGLQAEASSPRTQVA